MKNFNYIFIFSAFALFFTSCEKDIDVDVSGFESNIVINSIFNSDSFWKVDVSNSKNILDHESFIGDIEDALVMITDLDTKEEILLEYSEELGEFTTETSPKAFGSYRIDVSHPDYKSAHAINTIPSTIQIVELDTSTVLYQGEETLQIDFNIVDNSEEDNFYVWDIINSNDDNSDILPNEQADLISNDANFESISEQGELNQSKIFFQDSEFNGTEYQASFLTFKNRSQVGENSNVEGETEEIKLQLRILSVSEELFEYLKSVEAYYQRNRPNTSSVHPVEIHSNVVNGLGIFGAYDQTLIDLN